MEKIYKITNEYGEFWFNEDRNGNSTQFVKTSDIREALVELRDKYKKREKYSRQRSESIKKSEEGAFNYGKQCAYEDAVEDLETIITKLKEEPNNNWYISGEKDENTKGKIYA